VAFWGIYERLDPAGWSNFITNTAHVPDYQRQVLHTNFFEIQSITDYIHEHPVRVASLVLSPFTLAEMTLIGVAISLDTVIRGARTAFAMAAVGLFGVVLIVTQVRIEVYAVAALTGVLLMVRHGRVRAGGRVRLLTAAVIVVAVAVPFLHGSRLLGSTHGSNNGHKDEIAYGLAQIAHHPKGAGLGTAPDVGRRFAVTTVAVSDNSIIQVGQELGIVELVIFVMFLLVVLFRLYRAASLLPDEPIPRAALAATIGFIVAGMSHHVFLDYINTWTLFGLIGISFGMADLANARPRVPSPVPLASRSLAPAAPGARRWA
jgi:O-antigen ligase